MSSSQRGWGNINTSTVQTTHCNIKALAFNTNQIFYRNNCIFKYDSPGCKEIRGNFCFVCTLGILALLIYLCTYRGKAKIPKVQTKQKVPRISLPGWLWIPSHFHFLFAKAQSRSRVFFNQQAWNAFWTCNMIQVLFYK